jgi:hypothetical protein
MTKHRNAITESLDRGWNFREDGQPSGAPGLFDRGLLEYAIPTVPAEATENAAKRQSHNRDARR